MFEYICHKYSFGHLSVSINLIQIYRGIRSCPLPNQFLRTYSWVCQSVTIIWILECIQIWKIHTVLHTNICIQTFVCVKLSIWIYSDILSCNFFDTNIFWHFFYEYYTLQQIYIAVATNTIQIAVKMKITSIHNSCMRLLFPVDVGLSFCYASDSRWKSNC